MPRAEAHARLEFVKWIGVLSMTIDHYGKIVEPSVYDETYAMGRLAYPLFAWIIAARLVDRPALAERYLIWLLPWALLSQPVFVIAGKEWLQWNILFTLFFGVLAHVGITAIHRGAPFRGLALLPIGVAGAWFSEYGLFGVALIPALAACRQRGRTFALVALGPLSLAANITMHAPWLTALDLFAFLSAPLVYLACLSRFTIPRLPKLFFYAYYPVHVYILHITDWYLL